MVAEEVESISEWRLAFKLLTSEKRKILHDWMMILSIYLTDGRTEGITD